MQYLKGNTLVDEPRRALIRILLNETEGLPGIVAEVGVWRGGTARMICETTYKRVLLFDTFTGMPPVDATKDTHREGDFDDTSVQHVTTLLSQGNNTNFALYQGIFPDTNSQYAEHETFSFVHLDVDIYPSIKNCLNFFIPRMNQGGVIVLDDYNEPGCPGAKLATDEICLEKGLVVTPTTQSQAIIRF